jgi:hypothetical protein
MRENMLGSYGRWANGLVGGQPARLSFCNERFKSLSAWKKNAVAKAEELLAEPDLGGDLIVRVEKQYEYDGLHVEELSWQLPMGPRTKAVFFKPAVSKGKLPAVLALHDHGGRKYFGLRKIVRLPGRRHPLIVEHQREHYSDLGWANELAKRGYAVLVHDAFLFGSRRIRYGEVPDTLRRGRKKITRKPGAKCWNTIIGLEHKSRSWPSRSFVPARPGRAFFWPRIARRSLICAADAMLTPTE